MLLKPLLSLRQEQQGRVVAGPTQKTEVEMLDSGLVVLRENISGTAGR